MNLEEETLNRTLNNRKKLRIIVRKLSIDMETR